MGLRREISSREKKDSSKSQSYGGKRTFAKFLTVLFKVTRLRGYEGEKWQIHPPILPLLLDDAVNCYIWIYSSSWFA